MNIADLDQAIKQVCPIHGVSHSVGKPIEINYKAEATQEQRAAAAEVVDNFNWNAETPEEIEKATVRDQILALLAKPDSEVTSAEIKWLVLKMAKYIERKGL